MKPEIEIDGALTKVKKIRKDRAHFQRSKFDDDAPTRKAAGKKGHSRMLPNEAVVVETLEAFDDYDISLEEVKRVLR